MKALITNKLTEHSVTPEAVYLNRRQWLKASAVGAAGLLAPSMKAVEVAPGDDPAPPWLQSQNKQASPSPFSSTEKLTPYEYVTGYNNFYEFGTGKDDPEKYGQDFNPHPWQVTVSGLAEGTGTFDLEDLLKGLAVEERIYRLRCVEAGSMGIPWLGVPMAALLKRVKPRSGAQYVTFESVYRPEEMPGQRSFFGAIDYPYIEGLRMDEAMHPLTLMATGVYGRSLPNQNGAPLRLVVPWKYGFKSIKSIRKITFTDRAPQTTWQKSNAREYGFYANVNPAVDHPRWSQAEERRLPSTLFASNRVPTLPFNGYADAVGSLYQGMDLTKYY
jgi:sulfoxide reductase catalytic subunit YedY